MSLNPRLSKPKLLMETGSKKMELKKRKRDDKAGQKPKGAKKHVPGKVARAPEKAQEKWAKKENQTATNADKNEPKSAKERRLASKVCVCVSVSVRCLCILNLNACCYLQALQCFQFLRLSLILQEDFANI